MCNLPLFPLCIKTDFNFIKNMHSEWHSIVANYDNYNATRFVFVCTADAHQRQYKAYRLVSIWNFHISSIIKNWMLSVLCASFACEWIGSMKSSFDYYIYISTAFQLMKYYRWMNETLEVQRKLFQARMSRTM